MKQAFTVLAVLGILLLIGLTIISNLIPETYIYLGRQVPKKFTKEIRDLGLLDEDEKLKYFYSVGFIDIKDGFYFVTDSKLVAYSKDWEEPEAIVYFDDIIDLDITYNESFFEDSYVSLETSFGMQLEFPLSSEKDRDKEFYDYIVEKSDVSKNKEKYDKLFEGLEEE
jgi:hypothetical protein